MKWRTSLGLGLRRVFSNRNILVVSVTNSMSTFFWTVYNPYWALYLKDEMGLSLPLIGLLSTINQAQHLLFQLPGGILADRIGRKKVILIGAISRMAGPLTYLVAGSFPLLVLGTLLHAMHSVSQAAHTAMIAESLPRERIGSGYGVYNMMGKLPALFTGILGGLLMDYFGVGWGTKICFIGGFILGVVVLVSSYLFITETLERKDMKSSALQDFKDVLPLFKGSLQAMQVTSAVYQFAAGLTSQLIVLYVVGVIGLTKTEWGLIGTVMSVIGFLLSMPSGMIADRYDRVKLNILARSIYPITTIGYIYLRNFWLILGTRMAAGIGMGLSGAAETGTIGGPAWQSLMADIVPKEKRGRVSGFMSTVSGIVALPAPYLGAYMWDNPAIGPENTMWTVILLGIASTGFFGAYVKDPRSRQETEAEPPRQTADDKDENSTRTASKSGSA